MGYEKQTFVDKETVLKAEYLERMEDGIIGAEELLCVTVAVNDGISGEHGSISAGTDITFSELQLAYESGKLPYVKLAFSDGESTVLHLVKYYGDAMVFSNAVGAASMSDVAGYAFAATISSSGDVDVSWDILGSAGVSSWNDLADKPFYEESGAEVLLEEQTFTSVLDPDFGYTYGDTNATFQFVLGETYRVVWDNEEYTCEAMDGSAMAEGAVFVGNASGIPGIPHNNEPFAVATVGTMLIIICATDTAPNEHTMAIYQDTTVIKTLDEKFLPMDAIDERINEALGVIENGTY